MGTSGDRLPLSGWFLMRPVLVIEEPDNGDDEDQNGDGLVCTKLNDGQSAKNGRISLTIKENTNPLKFSGEHMKRVRVLGIGLVLTLRLGPGYVGSVGGMRIKQPVNGTVLTTG